MKLTNLRGGMRRHLVVLNVALWLSTFYLQLNACFAQGSLTPPGPPGPTMKSLDQIEARTPITNSGAVTIAAAGSYYLTRNITVSSGDAITINSDNVTLDLNGFSISSTAPSANGAAINLVGVRRNISIANGFISSGVSISAGAFSGSGFSYGIDYATAVPANVRVVNIAVSGVLTFGIYLGGNSTSIRSCLVDTAGDTGLNAAYVVDSIANNCGSYGISATFAKDCMGSTVGGGSGVSASSAINCTGSSSSGTGVFASDVAANCRAFTAVSGTGLHANIANNCLGYTPTGGNALEATIANGCYGLNNGTGDGVHASIGANTSYGSTLSGYGVYTGGTANNSYGYSFGGNGVYAVQVAMNSYGRSDGSVFGLLAGAVAVGCAGSSASNYDVWANSIAVACYGPGVLGAHGARMYNMIGCSGCP